MESIKAPSNYKDQEKIAEYIASKKAEIERSCDDQIEEKYRRGALDGALGEVYCIGFSFDGEEVKVLSRGTDLSFESERSLMEDFLGLTTKGVIRPIGHNIINFDMRFLIQRAIVLGVRLPLWLKRDLKPWSEDIFDTMQRWSGARDTVSLSKLCEAFDIPDGDEIDGSQVWDCIKAGEHDKVVKHCAHDIRKLIAIHNRMQAAYA